MSPTPIEEQPTHLKILEGPSPSPKSHVDLVVKGRGVGSTVDKLEKQRCSTCGNNCSMSAYVIGMNFLMLQVGQRS